MEVGCWTIDIQDTQRIMDFNLEREKVRSLFIDLVAEFPRYVLVEFILDELLDSAVNAGVNLLFNLRVDYR